MQQQQQQQHWQGGPAGPGWTGPGSNLGAIAHPPVQERWDGGMAGAGGRLPLVVTWAGPAASAGPTTPPLGVFAALMAGLEQRGLAQLVYSGIAFCSGKRNNCRGLHFRAFQRFNALPRAFRPP